MNVCRLVRRIDLRLVPASMFIYLLCFLDRSNIVSIFGCVQLIPCRLTGTYQGNAKILNQNAGDSLEETIHISDKQYLVALIIFIIAYILFEVPSNYMLKRFQPSRW